MRKVVLGFLLFFVSMNVQAQDYSWLSFTNLNQYNPVLPGYMKQDTGLTIILPGLSNTIFQSGPALSSFLIEESAGNYKLNFDEVIDEFESRNDLQLEVKAPLIAVDFRKGKNMFSFGYGINARSFLRYSKDLINLYHFGNAPYIDQQMDLSHQFLIDSHHEIFLGYVRQLGSFNIGGRVKILSGIGNISTPWNLISLYTDPDIYQLSLTTPSGLVINSSDGIEYNGIDDFNVDFKALSFSNIPNNIGFGLDLGIYGKTKGFSYAVSILDLGKINWTKNASEYRSSVETIYEGVDLLDFLNDEKDIVVEDSLKQLLDLERTDKDYSTSLFRKANFNVGYDINLKYTINAFFVLNNSMANMNSFGIINTYRIKSSQVNLTLAAVNSNLIVGLGTSINLGPAQLILSTDNVLGVVAPDAAAYSSFRGGLNFSF